MKHAAELALTNIDIKCGKESRVELGYVTLHNFVLCKYKDKIRTTALGGCIRTTDQDSSVSL